MMDIKTHHVVCAVIGIAAIALFYYASQNDGSNTFVPQIQTEAQFKGLGVQVSDNLNYMYPLSIGEGIQAHFWNPDTNPRDATEQSYCHTKHRYPVVPGGNVSTVIHKGWARMMESAPQGNNWFMNPPEAAVL